MASTYEVPIALERKRRGTNIKVPAELAQKMAYLVALKGLLTKTSEPAFICDLEQTIVILEQD